MDRFNEIVTVGRTLSRQSAKDPRFNSVVPLSSNTDNQCRKDIAHEPIRQQTILEPVQSHYRYVYISLSSPSGSILNDDRCRFPDS